MNPASLFEQEASQAFYEDRFRKGYMEEWDDNKKQRIYAILKELSVPDGANILDFGCGNGVFTRVIRSAFPSCNIYGCDISGIAITNAATALPDCRFFLSDDIKHAGIIFDLVFSHHVLEHVYDLETVMGEVNAIMREDAQQLHVCPCGNENSLEHSISRLIQNGIDPAVGNRFFFEDIGHVRRLCTSDMNELMQRGRWQLKKAYYSNQYWGSLQWMCGAGPVTFAAFVNIFKTRNAGSAIKLIGKMAYPLSLYMLQFPYLLHTKSRSMAGLKGRVIRAASALPAYLARPFRRFIDRKSAEEWEARKQDATGSEMYLLYGRTAD